MLLGKYDQCSYFGIFSRRYHDNKVLLAAHKVGTHNKIVFLKDKGMGTEPYYCSGKTIKKYGTTSNGSIKVYVVPIEELEPLTINQKDIRALI
jgi:hypothetical protein